MKNAMLLSVSLCAIVALSACGGGAIMGQPSAPAVTLSANNLAFPDEAPGSASASQAVTLSNSGTAPLKIIGTSVGANFQEVDDCVSPLAVGAQCSINVTFVPTTTGNLLGTVTLTDNAPGSPHTISLSGNGVISGPPSPPTLTGYCFGASSIDLHLCAVAKDVISCPVGQVASKPEFTSLTCPNTLQYVDSSTSCQGKTSSGLTVKGNCLAAQ